MIKIKKLIIKYQDVLFPVFDVLLNGFNFLMHIYISWFISMNDYSIFNALLSLLAILFVMGISIQTYTNKELGKTKDDLSIASSLLSFIMILLVILNIIMIILIPTLMIVMRTSLISIVIIILIFDVNLLLSFYRGVMQSRQIFLKLNISFYIEVVSKLMIIVVLLPFFKGVVVPLLAILIGMLLSLGHAKKVLDKDLELKIKISKKLKKILNPLIQVIWSNFFLYYLTSINLIVANYFIGEKAGLYAVSLKFSQLILAIGFSVITVLVSYSSKLVLDLNAFTKYINKWLIRFVIGGGVILLAYHFVVRHMIQFLFGDIYSGAKEFIVIQGFAYVLLTISYYIISVMIIMNQKIHLYILGGVSCFLTFGLIVNHESIQSIIGIEVVSYSLLFVSLLIWFLRRERKYGK